MNKFEKQYIISALWASVDDSGDPLDKNYSEDDLSDSLKKTVSEDCEAFVAKCGDLLNELDYSQVAHDFFLTRNGHGAGFWDGDYEEELGKKLTNIAKSFGEMNIYVGDDGKLYC